MSQKATEINPILPSLKQDWTDLNKDGKRLEKVIKICFKRIKNADENTDPQVILGFIAALNRTTHEKADLAKTVLGVKKLLSEVS